MTDREKFLKQARTYIGVMGNYVCNTKLHLGMVVDWCAASKDNQRFSERHCKKKVR